MLLCAACTESRGGPKTLEPENAKKQCSICTKFFQRYSIYQPERWSIPLSTAMCEDCAKVYQCCQVCYCDLGTLKVEKVRATLMPPDGIFLAEHVNTITTEHRFESTFDAHMSKFAPSLACKLLLAQLSHPTEEMQTEICSNVCTAKFEIETVMHKHRSDRSVTLTLRLTLKLRAAQQDTHCLDITATQTRISNYLNTMRDILISLRRIAKNRRIQLASVFTSGDKSRSCSRHTSNANEYPIVTETKTHILSHSTYAITVALQSTHPAELLCLLRNYTVYDEEVNTSIIVSTTTLVTPSNRSQW